MSLSLRYHLHAQSKYVQGGPIVIGFSLENPSPNAVWILKWYTPLEGIKGKIFELKCDGEDIPYEGRMVKRGAPEQEDYIWLEAGSSVQVEVDLSRDYSFPKCGDCKLKFKGRIFDVVSDEHQVPRASSEHIFIDIPGNSVSFSIVGVT